MIYKSNNNYIQNILPKESTYFKEEAISEILTISCPKPDIEKVLDLMVWPEVEEMEIVDTAQGVSNEGQRLSGIKLLVKIRLREKLTYVADDPEQSVHAAHFETLKSMFVILPQEVNGKKTCDLIRTKRISAMPYVEAVYPRLIDKRTINKCVLLFLDIKLC